MIQEKRIEYEHDGLMPEGLLAWDDASDKPDGRQRPGVMVVHAWAGRSEFECDKARKLAAQGYVGFAIDLYGQGVLGSSVEENAALMQPFMDDRALLQARLTRAFDVLRGLPEVDADKIAAIGFCFGGLAVLDLARIGTNLRGVVSFHGLLGAPGNTEGNKIKAKVLVLHGHDDPMAPPDSVNALADELTQAGADWQLHVCGNTLHAFTNPQANDPSFGTISYFTYMVLLQYYSLLSVS